MRKIKKCIVATCSAIAVLGAAVSVNAVTWGLTVDFTKNRAVINYGHGRTCSMVKAEGDFWEHHRTTNHDYHDVFANYAYGSSSVTASRYADEGYDYKQLTAKGYYDGNLEFTSSRLSPRG